MNNVKECEWRVVFGEDEDVTDAHLQTLREFTTDPLTSLIGVATEKGHYILCGPRNARAEMFLKNDVLNRALGSDVDLLVKCGKCKIAVNATFVQTGSGSKLQCQKCRSSWCS